MFGLQYLILLLIIIQRKEIVTISTNNCIGGVVVGLLPLNELDIWFDQTKDYKKLVFVAFRL